MATNDSPFGHYDIGEKDDRAFTATYGDFEITYAANTEGKGGFVDVRKGGETVVVTYITDSQNPADVVNSEAGITVITKEVKTSFGKTVEGANRNAAAKAATQAPTTDVATGEAKTAVATAPSKGPSHGS